MVIAGRRCPSYGHGLRAGEGHPAFTTTKTIGRKHLFEAVHQEIGLSRDLAARLVEAVIEEVAGALAEGSPVKISSFGSFTVREKAERIGRNPKTGEPARIPPRRVVTFKPSGVLKARVNRALGDHT